jgi:hypothetical protein
MGTATAMTDRNDDITTTEELRDRDVSYAPPVVAQPVVEPVVTQVQPDRRDVVTEVARPSRVPAFLAGFVTAIVVAAIAFVAFLAVSDSDDDGNIDVDVPAVEVDTDSDTGA